MNEFTDEVVLWLEYDEAVELGTMLLNEAYPYTTGKKPVDNDHIDVV